MSAINVNLDRDCYCERLGVGADPHHVAACPAKPIPLPCPVPPSFTAKVVLGECNAGCPAPGAARALKERGESHHAHCPARPVPVSCSITSPDGTWAGSGAVDIEAETPTTVDAMGRIAVALDARWALVKALVLGKGKDGVLPQTPNAMVARVFNLFTQRDAVFSALADMARAEEALWNATASVFRAAHGVCVVTEMHVTDPSDPDVELFTERWLAAYVGHLIEQVGTLTNGGT